MKFSEVKSGRVFVIRLEDGDLLHECIERFAKNHKISAASLICLGGADAGSILITGPKQGRAIPITPNEVILNDVHEVTGTGTLFPNEKGDPVLHMHLACGRNHNTFTGCVRRGVKVWHIMEIILYEIIRCHSIRALDSSTGLELLEP